MKNSHKDEVLRLLRTQISDPEEVEEISQTAEEVAEKWVHPLGGGGKEEINGLIYGLVQSGKTGVLTVSGALGADEGYRAVIILTSDIDPLYNQTLGRIQEAFPGIDIFSKADIKDQGAFLRRIKSGTCAIVMTKNARLLGVLVENFKTGKVPGLSCLLIDDEADQASLNTKARKADGTRSAINEKIGELRSYFDKSTYLQVTATPQALFLQQRGHAFRPKFTVLSRPGADYIGGDEFFGPGSQLVREFDINDIGALSAAGQPNPGLEIPKSLLASLDTFMIGATYKRMKDASQNCAFLCHVSTRTSDHTHIVELLRKYKSDLANGAKNQSKPVLDRLKAAYTDLSSTHAGLKATDFDDLVDKIAFYSPGITVKLVNGETDEDVAVRSPYNLFVGGNKLGRGVTIRNLLVSYYGRNPRSPQADTVLQHARMYGYRRADLGLLRLFLPNELHAVFRAINKMEGALRELIGREPDEEFRAVYVEGAMSPTRRSVLAPGSIGAYSGGSTYNPAQVLRDVSVAPSTKKIDTMVAALPSKTFAELPINVLAKLVALTVPDESEAEFVWNSVAVGESLTEFAKLNGQATGYVYVDRDRGLVESRSETQGILTGGEAGLVPGEKMTLFLLRTKATGGREAAWWPQIRFPNGRYAFAFAL